MDKQRPLLQTSGLTIGYGAGTKRPCSISGPHDLTIHPGEMICLLGPNGSGKSTLLRTLAGLQPALQGKISIDGEGARLNPERLAKKISLVLTDPVRSNNLTVHALVALGRYPYSGWLGGLDDTDNSIIRQALEATGTSAYADRKMWTLSDGESQKVMLARALAQDTPLMMLDEPTAHLDLPSRIQLMQLLHGLARRTNKGILVSTHELDLALQVADTVWLLQTGGRLDRGMPEELVLDGVFEAAFDKEGILFDKSSGTFHIQTGQVRQLRFDGEGIAAFWTRRALKRLGFDIAGHSPAIPLIGVSEENGKPRWSVTDTNSLQQFDSLSDLLSHLK